MKCQNCGMDYNEALGKCPYCLQRKPIQTPNEITSAAPIFNGTPPVSSVPPAGAVPPYVSVPPAGAVPRYGSVPPAGAVPPYSSVPPAGAVPPYSSVPPAWAVPPYSSAPPPPYAPAGYAPPAYGVPPQNKKRSLMIGIGIAGFAIVVALVVLFIVNWRQEQKYQKNLDLGYRYLDQGYYNEAVLAFEAAIDIRPRSGEAYVGLGDAYTGIEAFDNARDSYEQARKLDKSLVDAYLGLANAYLEMGDIEAAIRTLEEGLDVTQDREIEEWLEALRNMIGNASLRGTVSEYLSDGGSAPLPGARIRVYTTGTNEARLLCAAATDHNGAFELANLSSGTVTLHVEAAGHIGLVTTETLVAGTVNYTDLFLLIPAVTGEASPNSFYATVTNAINGEGVPGAEVRLRRGWNNTSGRLVTSDAIITDYSGSLYVQGLDFGYYTAEIQAEGFVTSFHNVSIVPEQFDTEWNLSISPRLSAGETRIVLTWGELPYDLDSHLYNDNFHMFFGEPDYYQNGEHIANLDLDDTDSYGPETITIYRLSENYTYYVHDFTNGRYRENTQLCTSGATVRVYQADGLVATFHVPSGFTGDRWNVFTLTADGSIIPINTIDMDDYAWDNYNGYGGYGG